MQENAQQQEPPTLGQLRLLLEWDEGTQFIYRAHYASAIEHQRNSLWLGIPTVVLSAIVGTSVFAALGKEPSRCVQIAVGVTSVLVTTLAALQTFLRYAERAEKHRSTGARFAALNKEVHQLRAFPPKTSADLKTWMDDFRSRWDALSADSPTNTGRAWSYAHSRKQLGSKAVRPDEIPKNNFEHQPRSVQDIEHDPTFSRENGES